MGQPWPQKWLETEEALLQHREYHIDANTYTHCCSANGVKADIAKGALGNYLHDLGKILYFRDDYILSNLVVLKPNWVTKAISRVLDDESTSTANGILLHSELPRIWEKDENGYPYEPYLYHIFLRLMERFELSYQIESDTPEGNSMKSLIPLLLPHQPPANVPLWPKNPIDNNSQVEMVYRLDFIPAGIISRFIVRTHRYTKNLHWREGVILEYQGHQAKVELNPMLRELKLLVQGPLPQNFFTILMNTIDVILARFQGLTIRREIPCICHQRAGVTDPCPRFYRYEDLVRRMEAGKHTIDCPDTLIEVSVPMLLYGIHTSTDQQIMIDIKQEQQSIEKKLNNLQKLDAILEKLNQQSELIGRNFTRQWNLEMHKMGVDCPSTFILMLGGDTIFNPKNWISQEYLLYLICQHPPGPHRVKDSYTLRKGKDWWVTVSPWLNRLINFLKFAVPMFKAIEALYDAEATDVKQLQASIGLMGQITSSLLELPEMDNTKHVIKPSQLDFDQQSIGPALRALQAFLKEIDTNEIWGGLHKILTPDGNILWLCEKHSKQYEVKRLQLEI